MIYSNFIKADERIRKDFALQIFEPDQFVSYQNKYTFFFGSKSEDKSLNDVLIEEQISQELTLTHIAEKGQVVSKRNLNSLILKKN